MTIRRAQPEIVTDDIAAAHEFYEGFLGFDVGMDLGTFVLWVSPDHPDVQVMANASPIDAPPLPPGFTVDVGTGEAVQQAFDECERRGYEVVEPLSDKPWGIRRFSVLDPAGTRVSIIAHI